MDVDPLELQTVRIPRLEGEASHGAGGKGEVQVDDVFFGEALRTDEIHAESIAMPDGRLQRTRDAYCTPCAVGTVRTWWYDIYQADPVIVARLWAGTMTGEGDGRTYGRIDAPQTHTV